MGGWAAGSDNLVVGGTAYLTGTTTPVLTASTGHLALDAAQITIDGEGFDPIAANDTVTFNDGAIGTVTAATFKSATRPSRRRTRADGTGAGARRREAPVAGAQLRTHLTQRLDDPVDGAAADRLVAVERELAPLLRGQPAGQQAHAACRRCRRRSAAVGSHAWRRPVPRTTSSSPWTSTSAPSARTASSVEVVSAACR